MKAALVTLIAALAACHSFESPEIVLDLRVLSVSAEPPEQVIQFDLQQPPPLEVLAQQLVETDVCLTVADPKADRAIDWRMTLCAFDDDGRCSEQPAYIAAEGQMPDPETSPSLTAADFCGAILPYDRNTFLVSDQFLAVVKAAYLQADFGGLGGIDYGVSVEVKGTDQTWDEAVFAMKTLRLAAAVPAGRTANRNPDLDRIKVAVGENGNQDPLPTGRCIEQPSPYPTSPGTLLELTPDEAPGAREMYTVATLSGGTREFTEALTYQWLAGSGNYSEGNTGGGHDLLGNPATIHTDWVAPLKTGTTGRKVPIWVVQRDERLGVHVFESCIFVLPSEPPDPTP